MACARTVPYGLHAPLNRERCCLCQARLPSSLEALVRPAACSIVNTGMGGWVVLVFTHKEDLKWYDVEASKPPV